LNELYFGDKKGVIHILDADCFEVKDKIEKKHNHAVTSMVISEDGKTLVTGDTYRYMYAFQVEERKEIGCWAYHQSKVTHLAINHDGSIIASLGNDRSIGLA
jgi:WD40 repeat protein